MTRFGSRGVVRRHAARPASRISRSHFRPSRAKRSEEGVLLTAITFADRGDAGAAGVLKLARLFVRAAAFALTATAAAAFLSPAAAKGGVVIASQSAEVDTARERAFFTLEFDGVPDFYTLNEFGAVKDSFQYEIDAGGPVQGEGIVGDIEAVVRGDEIRTGDGLRIRTWGPGVESDPDPLSGGWGPVRATVPFELRESVLTFDVPLNAFGEAAADGVFSYYLFTTNFGATNSFVFGTAVPIPLPPGGWAGATTVLGYVLLCALRRK
jgi:hypothetical protein